MWLSAVLLLTMVLTLLEVFILGHYDPPSTGRIQQLDYNTNHKQGATELLKLLNKHLLMVAFWNAENYPIWFENLNNSIQNEENTKSHSTNHKRQVKIVGQALATPGGDITINNDSLVLVVTTGLPVLELWRLG